MSAYTVEQVEAMASYLRAAPATSMIGTHISVECSRAVAMYEALCAYAELLREREALTADIAAEHAIENEDAISRQHEAAKARVTVEMVHAALEAYKVAARLPVDKDSPYYPNEPLHAALEAVAPMLASVRVPEGWQLVPVEPTKQMLDHANTACRAANFYVQGEKVRDPEVHERVLLAAAYRAMLTVAPHRGEG